MPQARYAAAPDAGRTLSKAVIRAADLLGFNQAALADILCLSPSSVSRLAGGSYILSPGRKGEWELALLFARLFRSLDAILGHTRQARLWLENRNTALNGIPAELVRKPEGLVRVLNYLDAYRGRI
ncbi:MAG: antitoxin Xre/MbcA/ParS toxin-binding domain-containing protein [Rhodospirillaceae bacterium]